MATLPGPVEFRYRCLRCGYGTVSRSPDLEVCPIPVHTSCVNGVITLSEELCGGELNDEGPTLWWWQLPQEIQEAIRDHNSTIPNRQGDAT